MIDNKLPIPKIYKDMEERGFFNLETYLLLSDIKWFKIEKIMAYDYEDGERKNIIPFARTARYDKWVWIYDDEKNYQVGFCPVVEDNGIFYAKNMEDTILRNIIEYVSSAHFYIKKENALSFQKSESNLKSLLLSWKKRFDGLLCDDYIDLIDYFTTLKLKDFNHKIGGDWCALISYEERAALIDNYISYDMIDKEFPIYM